MSFPGSPFQENKTLPSLGGGSFLSGSRGPNKLERLYVAQEGRCFLCREWMDLTEISRDHLTPRAKGGNRRRKNIVLAHNRCNNLKADRSPNPQEVKARRELYARAFTLSGEEVREGLRTLLGRDHVEGSEPEAV